MTSRDYVTLSLRQRDLITGHVVHVILRNRISLQLHQRNKLIYCVVYKTLKGVQLQTRDLTKVKL